MARNVDSFSLHFTQRCCCCCFLLFVGRPFVCSNQRTCMCTRLPNGRMTSTQSHISNMQPTHMVLSISVGSENEKRHICVVIIKIMNHLQCDFFHRKRCCCCQCQCQCRRRRARAPPSFNLHCICLLSHFGSLSPCLIAFICGLLFFWSHFIGVCFHCTFRSQSLSPFCHSFYQRVPHGFNIISSHNLIVDKYALSDTHRCLLFW